MKMPAVTRPEFLGALLFLLVTSPMAAHDASPFAGRWDATVVVNGVEIPCAFEIDARQGAIRGAFFNGERRIATNLNAFPTTFCLGRDGRVKGVHAGFPSPGSGAFHAEATRDVTAEVERLLAERRAGRH